MDVATLFDLHEKLLARARAEMSYEELLEIEQDCENAASYLRSLKHHKVVPVPEYKRGRVIGRSGYGINKIQNDTGTYLKEYGTGFLVIGKDEETLQKATKAINSSLR
jgi:hypothetical protein